MRKPRLTPRRRSASRSAVRPAATGSDCYENTSGLPGAGLAGVHCATMWRMLALITANLFRRRARTALTSAGIAVGVAAIVALLALSAGLNNTAGQLVHLGRADLGLFQRDAGDPTSSVVPLSLIPKLKAQPEVADATPLQLVIGAVRGVPSAIVFGVDPNGFVANRLVYTSGGGPVPPRGGVRRL